MQISAVDLFCGAGGLTCGLKRGGIAVRGGVDADPACRFPYEYNNAAEFVHSDIAKIRGEDLKRFYLADEFKLLAGCAPCQPFSTYTQGRNPEESSKWGLLYHFDRLVGEVEADLVTMENVVNLEDQQVFQDFVDGLRKREFKVWFGKVSCHEYGLPQIRKRLVLLASRLGSIELLPPRKNAGYQTVRQAISDLAPISAGGESATDPLHRASAMSPVNLERIRSSRPGGTWRDWPEELRAACHRKESGKSYPGVYGRMDWDAPAPTITTQFFGFGNGRFGHPEQDRGLSLREGAILQTFPHDYQFFAPGEKVYMKTIGRLIGNAVPVRLGEIIARSIMTHLNQVSGGSPETECVLRCFQ